MTGTNKIELLHPCDKCIKKFKRKDTLDAHDKLVHQKEKKQCEICGKRIAPTSFKRHKKSKRCLQTILNPTVPTPQPAMLNDSENTAAKKKQKPCLQCGKLMHPCSIRRHLKFKCNQDADRGQMVDALMPYEIQCKFINYCINITFVISESNRIFIIVILLFFRCFG